MLSSIHDFLIEIPELAAGIGFIGFFVGGFCIMNFMVAMTPEEAIARGYSPIPAGWEAGVFNHGSYIRWLLPENYPILFLAIVILWFYCIYLLNDTAITWSQK